MYICIYMSEIIDRYTENHNKIFFKVWVEKNTSSWDLKLIVRIGLTECLLPLILTP